MINLIILILNKEFLSNKKYEAFGINYREKNWSLIYLLAILKDYAYLIESAILQVIDNNNIPRFIQKYCFTRNTLIIFSSNRLS